jgi:hypothetical protein
MPKNLPDYGCYFDPLESIVRRHAPIIPEHTLRAACIHSVIREYLNACRGRTPPEALTRSPSF